MIIIAAYLLYYSRRAKINVWMEMTLMAMLLFQWIKCKF